MDASNDLESLIGHLGDRPQQRLQAIALLRDELQRAETEEVRRALAADVSWTRIGQALGVSRQAAHKRHHAAVNGNGANHNGNGGRQVSITPGARDVARLAREEAGRLGHREVRAEHVLVALARHDGPVARALAGVGITTERLRRALGGTPAVPFKAPATRPLPNSPEVSETLAESLRLAVARGDAELRPDHLAVALVAQDAGSAEALLTRLGSSWETVRLALGRTPR
jgi:ATP-dependent Clp protease ATP-binding subunit ClpA